jgi:hypothetical protein
VASDAIKHAAQSPTVLLLDQPNAFGPTQLALRTAGYEFAQTPLTPPFSHQIRSMLPNVDAVLLDVSTSGQDIMKAVQEFTSNLIIDGSRVRLICFSLVHRNARFVIELQKHGARYLRIEGFGLLLEALDLLLAEKAEFQRKGPCFRIVHRFSRGFCAPGEEIFAVKLAHGGDLFQLPFGLAERFVFNFVAQHRQVALDSKQIVSGLNDWFYREHAGNSGVRQFTKIRVATMKVVVQRIRKAMSSTFAKAQVHCDPFDVLRSFPAEGTRRVFYKLLADVHWDHPSQ